MRKCLKRSVVLLLLLTLCLTAISAINTTPANAAANEIMVFQYPRPADNNKNNWGKEAMSFMGGWSQRAADNFSVYSNDYSGKIYYCIEPGQYIKTGDSYVEKDEAYWDNFPRNSTIDRDEIKEHIGRIFQYGYIGTININWTSQNDADTLGNVIATQILIWEVVVGERDSDFNHVAPGAAYDAVLDIVSPNHPVYSQIMKQYNRIVNAMQAHLDSPSFMAEEKDKAETVELRWNGTEYSASLTDTNNVLSNYEIKPSDTNVQVTVSGNKLILTSKVAVNNVTLTAIRTLKRSGLITWASSTRQDLTKPYSAEVSDPLQAFIKLKTQQTGSIKGIKVDTNGNPLAGAEIGLFYGSETNLIAKEAIKVLTTGADGVFEFDNIAYGKYIVKELTAPNNYKLDDTAYKVEISENQKLVELEIVNEAKPHELVILKVDENNKPIFGVVFLVERSFDGNMWTETDQITTDETGKAYIKDLIPEMYCKVTEIQTQDGYTLLTEPIFEDKITTKDDPVITIKAINTYEFELPPTGGNSFLYIPIVLSLIMGAIVTIYYLIKEERGKNMKKFLVVIMALVMCFTTITTAFAADVNNATIDKNKTCSLTINKYAYEVKEINAIEGVEFTILNVAEIVTFKDNNVVQLLYGFDKESSAELLSAINLANGEGRYTQADNINASKYYYQQSIVSKAMADALLDNEIKVKNALESYISKNTNAQKMPLTNEKGKSVETGLNVGLYLVVETRVPENVIDTTNPFFVSLPMTVNGDTWNYDVVVYPKNETGNPTLEKEVKESQSSTGKTSEYGFYATASAGDIVEYKIQSTLPVVKSNATFLTEYCFVDTLSEGIRYIENEIVFEIYSDAACNSKVADWTEDKSLFTVTYENNVMKINISQKGLAEINNKYSEHTILIKYSAKVNSDESLILGESGNSNKVKLTWRRTSENYYDTLEDRAIVYSFGINITKHFSDKTDKEAYELGLYDKVEFKVYNETDKVWLVAENIDGIYYVKGYTTDESKATSFVPVNFSEEELGKLCVYGVEDDVYQIVEVNTAEGYTLLEENVELSIVFENENASAFVAGKEVEMNAKNESADATVSLNIVNNKVPDLPITGDTGMFMFVAIGVVLMTGAVIAIKKISRKNKD